MIRVILPHHLRRLARVEGEVRVAAAGAATVGGLVDALETAYPMLRGTIREHDTLRRRPFIRFFASREDVSLEGWDLPLPERVLTGQEPFLIVGAMAGG